MIFKLFLPFLFFFALKSNAQNYKPVDEGSKVHFVIKNFGINTGGDFSGLQGEINFQPNNLSASKFNVTISASTVDTDNSQRDKHLRSDEFFNVATYPDIRIVSTKIDKTNKTNKGYYYFNGEIIMHGITKTISFPFQVKRIKDDYLFTGEFKINRLDFGIGDNSVVLSNSVMVSLSVMAKKS